MTARKSPHPPPANDQDSVPTVILRHTLPDSSVHYDWMIELPVAEQEHRLLTFRSPLRPDQPWLVSSRESVSIIERLPNHRAIYLTYEGEISGGRGQVVRVASGSCHFRSSVSNDTESLDRIEILILWEGESQPAAGYRLEHLESNKWTMNITYI